MLDETRLYNMTWPITSERKTAAKPAERAGPQFLTALAIALQNVPL